MSTHPQTPDGKRERLPRFAQSPQQLSPLLLQPRDRALLSDVARHGMLTTSLIAWLRESDPEPRWRFSSRLTLSRRLKLLFHHGYLERIARPLSYGSLEPVYVLDKAGARAVCSGGVCVGGVCAGGAVSRKRLFHETTHPESVHSESAARDQPAGLSEIALSEAALLKNAMQVRKLLPHQLETALMPLQLRVALTAACCEEGDGVDWRSGVNATFALEDVTDKTKRGSGRTAKTRRKVSATSKIKVVPEAFCAVRWQRRRLFFFVECDDGRWDEAEVLRRCALYHRYWEAGGFRQDYGLPPHVAFRMLWLTPNSARRELLAHWLAQVEQGQGMFLVGEAAAVIPEQISNELWWSGAARPQSLIPQITQLSQMPQPPQVFQPAQASSVPPLQQESSPSVGENTPIAESTAIAESMAAE